MLTPERAKEILRILQSLPDNKIEEVYDYVRFLHGQYRESGAVDYSESWNDEDLRDLVAASFSNAEGTIWGPEP